MFSKSAIAFILAIGLTSTLGAPQFAPISGNRPVYNEGGLLPGVGSLVGDLTTGLNGALSGRPMYQAPVQQVQPMQPVQQMQPIQPVQQMQPMLPVQQIQPMQPVQQMQPMVPMQAMQPVQQMQPFQQFRRAGKE